MTPDVNVLVSASRADHVHHPIAIAYIDALLQRPGFAMLTSQNEWRNLKQLCIDLNLRDNKIPAAGVASQLVPACFISGTASAPARMLL